MLSLMGWAWFLSKLALAGVSIGVLYSPTFRGKVFDATGVGALRGTVIAYLGTCIGLWLLAPALIALPAALIGTALVGATHVRQLPAGFAYLMLGRDPNPPPAQLPPGQAPETDDERRARIRREAEAAFRAAKK